jgi:hypothetical protein
MGVRSSSPVPSFQICDVSRGKSDTFASQRFPLKNGAFTLRSDGRALYFGQEGRNLGWKLLWRLA